MQNSVFSKTQISITDEILEEHRKKHPFIVKVEFDVKALDSHHEILVIPRNYNQYSESVAKLLSSKQATEKIDPLFEGAKLTLQNQIVYPILEDDDFNPDNNPSDFIYSLASKYQDIWDPVEMQTKYYNISDDPEKNRDFFDKYDKLLEETKTKFPFCYGLKFENQFGMKSFFILSKLSNSEKLKFMEEQKKLKESLFKKYFDKYSQSIQSILTVIADGMGIIDPISFDEQRKINNVNDESALEILKNISNHNDDIYFLIGEYQHKPFRDMLENKIHYSYPVDVSEVVPNVMFFIYNDILASFDIAKSINMEKAKDIIETFNKEYKIENGESTYQLIRKVGEIISK